MLVSRIIVGFLVALAALSIKQALTVMAAGSGLQEVPLTQAIIPLIITADQALMSVLATADSSAIAALDPVGSSATADSDHADGSLAIEGLAPVAGLSETGALAHAAVFLAIEDLDQTVGSLVTAGLIPAAASQAIAVLTHAEVFLEVAALTVEALAIVRVSHGADLVIVGGLSVEAGRLSA